MSPSTTRSGSPRRWRALDPRRLEPTARRGAELSPDGLGAGWRTLPRRRPARGPEEPPEHHRDSAEQRERERDEQTDRRERRPERRDHRRAERDQDRPDEAITELRRSAHPPRRPQGAGDEHEVRGVSNQLREPVGGRPVTEDLLARRQVLREGGVVDAGGSDAGDRVRRDETEDDVQDRADHTIADEQVELTLGEERD